MRRMAACVWKIRRGIAMERPVESPQEALTIFCRELPAASRMEARSGRATLQDTSPSPSSRHAPIQVLATRWPRAACNSASRALFVSLTARATASSLQS